jgi:hypothetical protein
MILFSGELLEWIANPLEIWLDIQGACLVNIFLKLVFGKTPS